MLDKILTALWRFVGNFRKTSLKIGIVFARICLLNIPNLFVPVLNGTRINVNNNGNDNNNNNIIIIIIIIIVIIIIKKKIRFRLVTLLYNSSNNFTNFVANLTTETLILSLLILPPSSCMQVVNLNSIFRDIFFYRTPQAIASVWCFLWHCRYRHVLFWERHIVRLKHWRCHFMSFWGFYIELFRNLYNIFWGIIVWRSIGGIIYTILVFQLLIMKWSKCGSTYAETDHITSIF